MSTVNKLYERKVYGDLKGYNLPHESEEKMVVDVDGNRYYVSEDLYMRVKRHLEKDLDPVLIRRDDGKIVRLMTQGQRGYVYRHRTEEQEEPEEEPVKREKRGIEKFMEEKVE